MLGAADIAQLFFGRLLEPFDSKLVEVREHREHSSMDLLQTGEKCDVEHVRFGERLRPRG